MAAVRVYLTRIRHLSRFCSVRSYLVCHFRIGQCSKSSRTTVRCGFCALASPELTALIMLLSSVI
ncbi:hypothetical protein EWM60_14005 [Candidatus Erwinia dacicola]|nr:hypothetical protein [Candidatus Erwinia dacicola]